MPNEKLLTQVRAYSAETTHVDPDMFAPHIHTILQNAVLKFNLAPDLYVDVGRLPATVDTLTALVDYLGEIGEKLSKKDNKTKNEEWETAKSGELRLYKLYVCCIHALYAFLGNSEPKDSDETPGLLSQKVCAYARTNVPGDLGGNAKKLWEKTFASESSRTVKVMLSLIYLCSHTAAPATTPAPPTTGGGATGGATGGSGS